MKTTAIDGETVTHHLDADETVTVDVHVSGTLTLTFESDPEPDPGLLPTNGSDYFTQAVPGWQASDPEACYSFDLFGVWVKDGVAYWGTDSGCSCPSPWEDLKRYDQLTAGDFAGTVAAFVAYALEYGSRNGTVYMHTDHSKNLPGLIGYLASNNVT